MEIERVGEEQRQSPWLQEYEKFIERQQQAQERHEGRSSPTPAWDTTLGRDSLRILRVNQLDAERLDVEIRYGLNWYFSKIFSFFKPSVIEDYQCELNAVLQLLIYRFSVFEHDQSFGDRMQNLKYRNEFAARKSRYERTVSPTRLQKAIHAALLIGVPWCFARLGRLSMNWNWSEYEQENWRRKLWKYLHYTEVYYGIANLINFLVFLVKGKYRSIADRALGMRLVYARPLMVRHVSFDYMNREIVWNGLAEIMIFLFPLINFEKLKSVAMSLFTRRNGSGANGSETGDIASEESLRTPQACGICHLDPIPIPYMSETCRHQFCYWCIKTSFMQSETAQVQCPVCQTQITSIKRVGSTLNI